MKNGKKEMELWEHLEELRWTLFKILGLLFVTTIAAFFFVDELLTLFMLPIELVSQSNPNIVIQQILISPFDGVMIKVKVSFLAGLTAAVPFILYFLWEFTKSALVQKEKNIFVWFCLLGTISFAFGVFCSYLLIVPTISAVTKLGITNVANLWSLRDFISFEFYWMLCGGIIFELPLLMLILTKLGVIEIATLKKIRLYYIIAAFVIAAIITPSTDPFTFCLVAIPMIILYEFGIMIASFRINRNTRNYGKK
jgi:sec-independent protein translocase protein TatC